MASQFHIKQIKGRTKYKIFMLREMQIQQFTGIKLTTSFSENEISEKTNGKILFDSIVITLLK